MSILTNILMKHKSLKTIGNRFSRNRKGVAAVEFALILPLMATLYFGSIDVVQGISAQRKLNNTIAAITDLVAREESISNADMENIFDATAMMMYPFTTDGLNIVLSGLKTDSATPAFEGIITWSRNMDGCLPNGTAVPVPEALDDDAFLIQANISYTFSPVIGILMTDDLTLSDSVTFQARSADVEYAQCE